MKKYSTKKISSPMVLIIPLIIASVIIVAAALFGRFSTENRSKASFASPLQQCINACNTNSRIKEKGACVLDCPKVIANTMTCTTFCTENVIPSSGVNKTTGKTQSSLVQCQKTCSRWAADPCGSTGICAGLKQYAAQCQTACAQVKSDAKTCAQAYTQQTFAKAPSSYVDMVLQKCVAAFE